jgi:hypothetical protein
MDLEGTNAKDDCAGEGQQQSNLSTNQISLILFLLNYDFHNFIIDFCGFCVINLILILSSHLRLDLPAVSEVILF